jgi:uncharacterized membrane protein
LHNNYLTLPVLFIMISSHFPMTYGHSANWLILAALMVISAAVRHQFNLKGQGRKNVWILPVAALAMIALAFAARPASNAASAADDAGKAPVSFAAVQAIFASRCLPCHTQNPTHPAFPVAPKGLTFDSPSEIRAKLAMIEAQVVFTAVMPLGNLTKMTEEERATLGLWIRQGAPAE